MIVLGFETNQSGLKMIGMMLREPIVKRRSLAILLAKEICHCTLLQENRKWTQFCGFLEAVTQEYISLDFWGKPKISRLLMTLIKFMKV